MQREYVDFFLISDAHMEIHARLENWARWQFNRGSGGMQPMFRMYRSPEHWGDEASANVVDPMDAQKMQKAVSALPGRNRLAVSWNYVKRTNPRKAASSLGESLEGLAILVRDGRQMLINRSA